MTLGPMTRILQFPLATSPVRGRGWASRMLIRIDRLLCGLRGHEMVMHFEPQRLSLHCLWCGTDTCGWTLDQRPPIQCPASATSLGRRSSSRILRFAA